jgi:hypothetical protein
MQSALKSIVVFCHFLLLGVLSILFYQGVDDVQEKLYVSLLIFITLNLIRLFLKDNGKTRNDQL